VVSVLFTTEVVCDVLFFLDSWGRQFLPLTSLNEQARTGLSTNFCSVEIRMDSRPRNPPTCHFYYHCINTWLSAATLIPDIHQKNSCRRKTSSTVLDRRNLYSTCNITTSCVFSGKVHKYTVWH